VDEECDVDITWFKPRRRSTGAYAVDGDKTTEEELLKRVMRAYPRLDKRSYQYWHDYRFRTTRETPSQRHAWLWKHKYLWTGNHRTIMDDDHHDAAFNAFAGLKDDGPAEKDVLWVKTHPRLFKARQIAEASELGPDTAVTAKDILSPCNGPAPTKSAVTMLQYALANPTKFMDAIMSVQKKSAERGGAPMVDSNDAATDEEMAAFMGR
jgi:hypothetical protein